MPSYSEIDVFYSKLWCRIPWEDLSVKQFDRLAHKNLNDHIFSGDLQASYLTISMIFLFVANFAYGWGPIVGETQGTHKLRSN